MEATHYYSIPIISLGDANVYLSPRLWLPPAKEERGLDLLPRCPAGLLVGRLVPLRVVIFSSLLKGS
jgi:hypothetical protein